MRLARIRRIPDRLPTVSFTDPSCTRIFPPDIDTFIVAESELTSLLRETNFEFVEFVDATDDVIADIDVDVDVDVNADVISNNAG